VPKRGEPERPADIELGARVRMKKVRFEEAPEVETESHGDPGHETESTRKRKNLPEEIEPGKTYRDAEEQRHVSIRLREDDD
jgi:hypothetical protein